MHFVPGGAPDVLQRNMNSGRHTAQETDGVTASLSSSLQMAISLDGEQGAHERQSDYDVGARRQLRSNRRAARSPDGATSRFEEVPVTATARRGLERELAGVREEQREIPARLRVARDFGDTASNDERLAIREEEAVPMKHFATWSGRSGGAVGWDRLGPIADRPGAARSPRERTCDRPAP